MFQKGIKGDKRIPFSSMGAVQFKRPGLLTGYIQFTIGGGVESTRGIIGAASDENTLQFVEAEEFDKARAFIEKKLADRDQPVPLSTTPKITVAEQLEKLASLLDRGLLTPDEFNTQKQLLLSEASKTTRGD